MDWKNGPCPSDTGLEDWQRLVRNCQISKRLSLNWLVGNGMVDWSEIGLALGWHCGSGLAVCWLDWSGTSVGPLQSWYHQLIARCPYGLVFDWLWIGHQLADW